MLHSNTNKGFKQIFLAHAKKWAFFFAERSDKIYAHFLKSKPNDAFLREMFTPQGITAKNVFQQFEQGASDVQAQKAQVVHFPEKWNEQFYCDLLKNKQAATAKRYEAKLKEELGGRCILAKRQVSGA